MREAMQGAPHHKTTASTTSTAARRFSNAAELRCGAQDEAKQLYNKAPTWAPQQRKRKREYEKREEQKSDNAA